MDANPGDGICADPDGYCSLRAAVMEANAFPGADTITVPAGNYLFTIAGAGEDGAATGDLDLTDDVTIAGAGTTIVDGSGLDRVLHAGSDGRGKRGNNHWRRCPGRGGNMELRRF